MRRPLTATAGFHGDRRLSRGRALKSLGPVVYAVRVGELIKIGFTHNLANRISGLKADEILAFVPGTMAEEQAIHARLSEYAVQGREWYPASCAPVLDVVDEMLDQIGMLGRA